MLKAYILAAGLTVLGGLPAFAAELPQLAALASPAAPQGDERGGLDSFHTAGERLAAASELASPEDFGDDADLDNPEDTDLAIPDDLPQSDIPLTFNSKVDYFVRYFQGSGRSSFAKWLSRSERFIPMMKKVLRDEKLPEDLVYLAMIESGFSPHAFSVASAVGPWQFMSATGKRYSLRIDPWIDERRDPLKSTVAAALYLKELYAMFNNDWYLAAAGYNAGENKIMRAISMYNSRNFWELSKGRYLARETKDYVPKLLAAAIIAKEPAKYGFAEVAYLPAIEYDTMPIPSRTDLDVVSKACSIHIDDLRALNPELRRGTTPPDYPGYRLKLPKGAAAGCAVEYAKVPESQRYVERVQHASYRVKKHETLASIARKFNTSPQVLAELNGLQLKTKKLKGRVLVIPVPAPVQTAQAQQPAAQAQAGQVPTAQVQTVQAAQAVPVAQAAHVAAAQSAKARTAAVNKYYTVKKGDTLFGLAKRFNVTTRILAAWNNLKTLALKPGKRLIVAKTQDRDA